MIDFLKVQQELSNLGIELPFPRIFQQAWTTSRTFFGNTLNLFLPGMFVLNGLHGAFPAVSITGNQCRQSCEHCKGNLLESMHHTTTPESLHEFGRLAWERGNVGLLISGGADHSGRLPWEKFAPIIERLKAETGLVITIHPGQLDVATARILADSGIDQALVDFTVDDETARAILHLDNGFSTIVDTMEALAKTGIEIVPHIILGLNFGKLGHEIEAVRRLGDYSIDKYVVVVLMPLRGTPMEKISPPSIEDVGIFLAEARAEMPYVKAGLGCARPRGMYKRNLDIVALSAGVNSIAFPNERTQAIAERLGLDVHFAKTCCSLDPENVRQ